MLSQLGSDSVWLIGEEEGQNGGGVNRVVMGDEKPGATFGFLLGGGGGGEGLREDGDAAGAGAGGEEGRVGVDGVDEGDNGSVKIAFWRFVWLRGVDGG